jgi:hypothetical protein
MAAANRHPNIHPAERLLTAAAGLALLLLAAKMPRARRPLVAMSTAVLLRSLTGYCPAYAAAATDGRDTFGVKRLLAN